MQRPRPASRRQGAHFHHRHSCGLNSSIDNNFLLRDAYALHVHTAVYAMARSPSVCPTVTSQYSIEMAE